MTLYNPSARIGRADNRSEINLYRQWVLPLFFKLEPETAHWVAMEGIRLAGQIPFGLQCLAGLFGLEDARLETDVFGLHFRNPVGLAAGYDKDARAVRELTALGFGHLEVGTVTPLPQAGNPRPRIFRIPEDKVVINRMGFPNQGARAMCTRLRRAHSRPIQARVGVNIGKGRQTPLERATEDYSQLLRQVHPYADFVTVNVSSPNTPDLRKLQNKQALAELLGELAQVRAAACPETPLLVKIAPDLTFAEIDNVLDVAAAAGVSGIVATNTTSNRHGVGSRRPARNESGGMSGEPLQRRSTRIIRHIYRQTKGAMPIIGVGGVNSVDAALEKIKAGASLVQVYTGLIYQGPGLVRAINQGLANRMSALGLERIGELVGTG